jgi:predicted DNA-binding transcriptional regulator YafY
MRAIRNHKRIRMEYLRVYDGTLTRREVEPYGMICRFNNWYLVAHCLQQQKRRIFLMDHVKQLKVVENSSFSQPEGFDLNIYNSAWGVWTMDEDNKAEAETVRLKAIKGIAERFKMVCFHDSQKVKMLEGGEAEVTFKVTGAVEMIPWLMSWGATVQVLEPQWLKDQLLQSLRETVGIYEAGN